MIGTESKLWEALDSHAPNESTFTRIETITRLGVSDVEYALKPWHGWIELKTSSSRRNGRLTLHSAFTLPQAQWLAVHHDPKHHMRSWLLIGFLGPRTWREFMLLPPNAAIHLVHVRKAPSYIMMRGHKGVVTCSTMDEVIATLKGE